MSERESKTSKWTVYGNNDSQFVVGGHSHVASILEATLNSEVQLGNDSRISVCYLTDWNTGLPGGQEYWQLVANSGRGKHIVIFWEGNQHNAHFMFQSEPKFTISGATDLPEDQDAVPIPRSMVRDFFRPSFEELTRIVPTMSGAASITLMSGPAPKPSSHIKASIKKETYFTDLATTLKMDLDAVVVTSDSLRLKLWEVLAELLASYAKTLGVNFLIAPAESRDIFGMLLPDYWAPDVTHANSKYGQLVIQEIVNMKGGVLHE